jgi:hypothetical protein
VATQKTTPVDSEEHQEVDYFGFPISFVIIIVLLAVSVMLTLFLHQMEGEWYTILNAGSAFGSDIRGFLNDAWSVEYCRELWGNGKTPGGERNAEWYVQWIFIFLLGILHVVYWSTYLGFSLCYIFFPSRKRAEMVDIVALVGVAVLVLSIPLYAGMMMTHSNVEDYNLPYC